jgi:hypothetical protein
MRWRRSRRGSGSTEHANIEGPPASDSNGPAALPQEVAAHIPFADEAAKPAHLPEALAVVAPDRHEHELPLATGLLETVSATAIQLHPTGPAEPTPASAESGPSDDPGEARTSQEATSVPQTARSSTTPVCTEVALAAGEPDSGAQSALDEQAIGAQSAAAPADPEDKEASAESRNPFSPEPVVTSDASSRDEVSAGASSWRGHTTTHAGPLVSPYELARTAVEANVTVWSYLRKEGDAALAHLRALSRAKSPTDFMDLQVSELARAHGAALKLGQDLVNAAGHIAEGPGSAPTEK